MSYLVIPRIQVRNANAQPAWWMVGPPPMTAYAGFSHALSLALGLAGCEGFGVVHHDIQFLGEDADWIFRPHQFRAASFIDKSDYSSKNKYALSTQPTARCHLVVSIVIKLHEDDAVDLEHLLPKFLRGGRLAGGTIVGRGKVDLFDTLERVIGYIKTGQAIHERQDLMVMQEGDRDMLDVMLRLTDPQARFEAKSKAHAGENEGDKEENALSWLIPSSLGYLAITEFRQRRKVRGDLPHAFVEPLVGMVQYKSIRSMGIPIWRPTNPDANTFLLTTSF